MKKIQNLFERDWDGDRSRVLNVVVPGSEWVQAGEGKATKKFDGTSALIRDEGGGISKLYRRFDAKKGKQPPRFFMPAQESDEKTGHWPGWIPVTGFEDQPENKWFMDALAHIDVSMNELVHYFSPGTYELCGPKIGGNPEGYDHHVFIKHGQVQYPNFPTDFDGITAAFDTLLYCDIEGVVWHHPDGRMVKIKRSDMGYRTRG